MKKIGILTLPPRINYGGILQAYALKESIERMGFEVDVIERLNNKPSILWKFFSHIRTVLLRIIGVNRSFTYWVSDDEFSLISQNTQRFTNDYLNKITVNSSDDLKKHCLNSSYYALVVGSDQVWRPNYVANIYDYFFDFKSSTKKIAYAASIGVPFWPYTKRQSIKIKKLLKSFDGVSVREDSAKKMLEENFRISYIEHVLDPTMLLEKEDYVKLVNDSKTKDYKGGLFTYLLDHNKEKDQIIQLVEKELGLEQYSCQPLDMNYHKRKIKNNIDPFIYPSVTDWLKAFIDAKYVITDSFHGCVFSIIFNKPFLVLSNKEKGQARFTSLLKVYGLENRLDNFLSHKYFIDWEKINKIKDKEKKKSLLFLSKYLNK